MRDFVFGVFVLLCCSLTVYSLWWNGLGLYLLQRGQSLIPRRFRSDRIEVPRFAVILTLAWLLTSIVFGSKESAPAEFDPVRWSDAVQKSVVVNTIVFCGLMTVILISVRNQIELVQLGFRKDDIFRQLQDGAFGFVLAFVPVYAVMLLTQSLRSEETVHPLLRLLQSSGFGGNLVWIGISAVILAPLVEELMYRVILQSWLTQYLGGFWAIFLTSIVFASAHGFPNSLGIFPLAVVLGIVYHQRRSYLAVIVLHALFNSFNLFAMLNQILQETAVAI